MIRGCQKKIIKIRDTKSKLFEEAYFILRCDIDTPHISEKDIISEATSIINSYTKGSKPVKAKRRKIRSLLYFFLGGVVGFLVFFSIYLLFL